jgi:hypothetical protein
MNPRAASERPPSRARGPFHPACLIFSRDARFVALLFAGTGIGLEFEVCQQAIMQGKARIFEYPTA